MKIADYKEFTIHIPTSGGKAGTGCNVTGSIQVRDSEGVKKQVRFTVDDPASRQRAMRKARQWCDEQKA